MIENLVIEVKNYIKNGATVHQAIEQVLNWDPLGNKKCPIAKEEYEYLVKQALTNF